MKLNLLSLCLLALLSCQTSIESDTFEKALIASIKIHEKINASILVKKMQYENILDSNRTYPYFKISTLINQQIDADMLRLSNTSLKDKEVKKIYHESILSTTNHFKNNELFFKSVAPYLNKKANIDSIFNAYNGRALRVLCRYYLELFKIECLQELVASVSPSCRWGLQGIDTLICRQIDQSKYSIDLIQSKDYVTNFVSIDSVIKNNIRLPLMPPTQAMKQSAILNFDTLASGNYSIKGSVNAVHNFQFVDNKQFIINYKK